MELWHSHDVRFFGLAHIFHDLPAFNHPSNWIHSTEDELTLEIPTFPDQSGDASRPKTWKIVALIRNRVSPEFAYQWFRQKIAEDAGRRDYNQRDALTLVIFSRHGWAKGGNYYHSPGLGTYVIPCKNPRIALRRLFGTFVRFLQAKLTTLFRKFDLVARTDLRPTWMVPFWSTLENTIRFDAQLLLNNGTGIKLSDKLERLLGSLFKNLEVFNMTEEEKTEENVEEDLALNMKLSEDLSYADHFLEQYSQAKAQKPKPSFMDGSHVGPPDRDALLRHLKESVNHVPKDSKTMKTSLSEEEKEAMKKWQEDIARKANRKIELFKMKMSLEDQFKILISASKNENYPAHQRELFRLRISKIEAQIAQTEDELRRCYGNV